MKTTKIESFEKIKPLVPSIKEQVLGVIKGNNGLSLTQIKELLNIKHQTASARLSELEETGLIKPFGRIGNETFWVGTIESEREMLIKNYRKNRYRNLLIGLKKYSDLMSADFKNELDKEI
jgi:predicted transcriptional regulator